MKSGIHPVYNTVTIKCACGAVIQGVGSTSSKKVITTDVCANCHPFWTGKQYATARANLVDKFKARQQKSKELAAKMQKKKKSASKKKEK